MASAERKGICKTENRTEINRGDIKQSLMRSNLAERNYCVEGIPEIMAENDARIMRIIQSIAGMKVKTSNRTQ